MKGGTKADTDSLRSHFAQLDGVARDRIFLVRRVQQLGLGSADAVQTHFSTYGTVERVLVAHSPVLSQCKTYVRHLRPSNMAIVVMASAAMTEAVHDDAMEHCIQGILVNVERYERRGNVCGVAGPECGYASRVVASSDKGELCLDGETTHDGGSAGASDCHSEDDSEDACISGDFEYWATDDEGW